MRKPGHGVGLNGETDDFSARYDRMVAGGGGAWVLRSLAALLVLLALVAIVSGVIGG